MNLLQKIPTEWPLRLGAGIMYLYSGYDLIVNPRHWYGFVPQWFSRAVTSVASLDTYLFIQGAGEFIIGLLLLSWFLGERTLQVASSLMFVEMGLILLFVGVDPITFRDIGLLGAAGALMCLAWKKKD